MAVRADRGANSSGIKSADNGDCGETGTRLANYSYTLSCGLLPAADAPRRAWGGARNRADRESWHLSLQQCEGIIAATKRAEQIGLPFNRHWTVHYERAGISEIDGARFVGHLRRLVKEYVRRNGGQFAAVWVRENGDGRGGHVHILMHLPAGLTLRNRTRRWIVAAGGKWRAKVSKVRSIGRSLQSCNRPGSDYGVNLEAVLAYVLKGASKAAGVVIGLRLVDERGRIVGKRAGWTQNVAVTTRGK